MKTLFRLLPFGALASIAILSGCGSSTPSPTTGTFQITLTDLTNTAANSGQPFSPPVFATHDSSVKLWSAGATASAGIQNIAEAGDRSVLIAALQPLVGGTIRSMATPLSSPLLPGGTVTVTVSADTSHPYLSSAWMLGRTNDGFSGQDTVDLMAISSTKTYELFGMDAGTENNNEKKGFLGALGGGNARDPENGVIHLHTGILGTADAPLSWNWSDGTNPASKTPVARVTITRVGP